MPRRLGAALVRLLLADCGGADARRPEAGAAMWMTTSNRDTYGTPGADRLLRVLPPPP